jgi:hypothetical protein
MGIYAFTEYCIYALWNEVGPNPYQVHDSIQLSKLLYNPDYWYGVVATKEWAESLYK